MTKFYAICQNLGLDPMHFSTENLIKLKQWCEDKTRMNPQFEWTSLLFSSLMLPIAHDKKMIEARQSIYLLLSKYCKHLLSERNDSGDTILHIMSIYGYSALIKDLLSKTTKLSLISNNLGHYPIHSAILNAQHECVKQLIVVKGVAQLVDAKKRNALHYAAQHGDTDMVKICLNSDIPINSVDIQNHTPLILATITNNTATVNALLDAGADVNITDNMNRSALHYAIELNHTEIVRQLLRSANINVNICDENSLNPLDLIQENSPSKKKIHELLTKKGAVHSTKSFIKS